MGGGEAVVGGGGEGVHTGHVEHTRLHHQLSLHCHIHPQACRLPPGEWGGNRIMTECFRGWMGGG